MFKQLKRSTQKHPKVSLILLDWGVRESFHLCHYLKKQTLSRNDFEIIVIEYYSKLTQAVKAFEDEIDTLALLGMPEGSYYHKHLMYNVGALLAQGEILIICDSDAMAKPTFLSSIVNFFETHENTVLHLDQFRNHRRDLYPFSYPTFHEVTGAGCINHSNGKTTGVAETFDLLHRRNYGACFCCRRDDFFAVGGADEHIDFVGHICGPYDLTFRLINLGKEEVWHPDEFLYHTWHPGTDGIGEYLGPHDGRNVSTTSLEALWSGRVEPHVSHPLIEKVRKGETLSEETLSQYAVSDIHRKITDLTFLKTSKGYAEQTYKSPRALSTHFSKKTKLHFLSMRFFQKGSGFIVKKLPLIFQKLRNALARPQKEWETLEQATHSHFEWWAILSTLYKKKKKAFIVTNTKRDLLILSELLEWQKKFSFRPKTHVEIFYFQDLNETLIEKLLQNRENKNLFLTSSTVYDWKLSEKLKNLEFNLL